MPSRRLLGIGLTPRCKVVRTILSEIGRIQNHLLCVGAAALDLGAFTGFLYGFNEREFLYDIIEYVSGQRYHPDWTRVGGSWRDIPDDEVFKRMVKSFLDERLPRAIKDLETLLNRNRIFVDRLQGVGQISREDAIAWGLSGPIARASGVRRDVRKSDPYLCFADNWDGEGAEPVSFSVPISNDGDCLARYMVRLRGDPAVGFDHPAADRSHSAGADEHLGRLEGEHAREGRRLRLDRGHHPALRAAHAQSRLGRSDRRELPRRRDRQRRARLLRRLRRRPLRMAGPHSATMRSSTIRSSPS